MSSDRPRTPPRSTISDQAEARERAIDVDGRATVTGSTYVPHVSDLVYSARDASRFADESIPPIYLEAEAVDSSILLGHGASFTASVRYVLSSYRFDFEAHQSILRAEFIS